MTNYIDKSKRITEGVRKSFKSATARCDITTAPAKSIT